MIQAQGPLKIFTEFHKKHCLIIGQGKVREITRDLGFEYTYFIEDIAKAYPLLDMVDHDNRKRIATEGYEEKKMDHKIEGQLIGEQFASL